MMKEIKINLGLLDLNTQTTGTAGLSPEMKTFYDKNLIRLVSPQLVHDQFAQKRNIPKNGGKTIEFRQFDSLPKATTPLTEGVTPNGNSMNVTAKYATVKQFGDYITMSDVLQMTTIDPIQTEAQEILADQAARTLDTITRDVICAGTYVQYANSKTTRAAVAADSSAKMAVIEIQKAVRWLKSNNAKPVSGGYYVAIIHPDCAYDIMRDSEWVSAASYAGSEQIFAGEIGRIAGCRFVETTEAKIVKSGDTSIYCTMVLGANAYGTTTLDGGGLEYIVTQLGSAGSADPLKQRSTSGWKAIKTAERLVEQYMVRIESVSTFSSVSEANGQYSSTDLQYANGDAGLMADNTAGSAVLASITVTSAAGTAAGDTALTISGYTPAAGESYVYKVATGTAPTIPYGAVPDYSWTAWDGSADITAATGKKITVVSINSDGKAIAAGSATVTAHA